MIEVLKGLQINHERIRRNLMLLRGVNLAESVMIELTKRGMNRQEAHEVMRTASMEALARDRDLGKVLRERPEVTRFISPVNWMLLLDPNAYTGTAVRQVDRLIEKLRPLCS